MSFDNDTKINTPASIAGVGRPCVLIVDDEPAIRLITRFVLESAGYAVAEVGTANDALARIHAAGRPFSVVILDYTLPDRNGTDLLPELRVITPRSQVILTSGRPEEDVPDHGADCYLAKPYSREQLLAAVYSATVVSVR